MYCDQTAIAREVGNQIGIGMFFTKINFKTAIFKSWPITFYRNF